MFTNYILIIFPNGGCGRKVVVKKALMLAKLEVLKRYLMLAKLEAQLEKARYGITDAFQRSGQNYGKREVWELFM